MNLWTWFRRRQETVSAAWMRSQALDETKIGWDGPRWRTPAERARMAREDRRRVLAVVPKRRAK